MCQFRDCVSFCCLLFAIVMKWGYEGKDKDKIIFHLLMLLKWKPANCNKYSCIKYTKKHSESISRINFETKSTGLHFSHQEFQNSQYV